MFGQSSDNDMNQTSSAPPMSPVMQISPNDNASIDASVNQLVSEPVVGAPAVEANTFSGSAMTSQPATVDPTSSPGMFTPPNTSPASTSTDTSDDLAQMKQEALKHLQPLVGSLQQSPEEEFRTVMMMIQATDDKTMLKKALESAKKITDDKVRAQAMLDVINEINYFTQAQ